MATPVHYAHGGEDILSLANSAVREGLIDNYILDRLTCLYLQVPKSMALKYVKEECYWFGDLFGWSNRQYIDDFLPDAIDTDSIADPMLKLDASKLTEILAKF